MVTFGARRILVITLVLTWFVTPLLLASELPASFRRIRVLPSCVRTLVVDAAVLSSTIRTLVARIERSDLIVYVNCTPFKNSVLAGRLIFMTTALGHRLVMIEIRSPEQWHTQMATVAHELQHAVEIANAPSIRSRAALARHYRRTGITVATNPYVFDTEAARQAGLRVQRELGGQAEPGR
jgi:hypothetical protein